jgi:hypothetical protein
MKGDMKMVTPAYRDETKWSTCSLDPAVEQRILHPTPEVEDMFGHASAEERRRGVDEAKAELQRRQREWIVLKLQLACVIPGHLANYALTLNERNHNAVCNAARMIYRYSGEEAQAVHELLDKMMEVRYDLHVPPAGLLDLVWDYQAQRFNPAPGTDWSDQDYPHGIHDRGRGYGASPLS